MPMVSVQALSNSILKRAFSEKIPVTPMKLQKLLYFIYRDYLQKTNHRLFSEPFQTWKYGPVLSSVYDEFKAFHANPINRFGKDAENRVFIINEAKVPAVSCSISKVWNLCKNHDGIYLSQLTHQPNTAWTKANNQQECYLNDEDIFHDRTTI